MKASEQDSEMWCCLGHAFAEASRRKSGTKELPAVKIDLFPQPTAFVGSDAARLRCVAAYSSTAKRATPSYCACELREEPVSFSQAALGGRDSGSN